MKQRAWDILAGVSLLLLVAAAGMWARSRWYHDETGVFVGRQLFAFMSAAGDTSWAWDTNYTGERTHFARARPLTGSSYARGISSSLDYRFAGFAFRHQYSPLAVRLSGTTYRVVAVPYWFLILVTAATPTYWLTVTRRRRRRVVTGLCAGCGYDLRASTGRCPECGRPFQTGRR